mgnify:CR=1 FL=1|jgi:hypothetical protein
MSPHPSVRICSVEAKLYDKAWDETMSRSYAIADGMT